MTGTAKMWLGLGVAYILLLLWHQPLQGPLSEAEVRAAFGERFEYMRDSEDPQAAAFLRFFLTDDGRPFYMINLNDLPEETPEIAEAARRYGTFMLPRLIARASYPVLTSNVIARLNNTLGADAGEFQRLIVVRYRSRRDFLNIISTTQFDGAFEHKHASLDGWLSAPATASPAFSVPQIAATAFFVLGGFGTVVGKRRRIPTGDNAQSGLNGS